jgi:hypothetical protein
MKRIVHLAAGAALLAGISTAAAAQDTMDGERFLKAPAFAILPSLLTTCVISCEDPAPGVSAESNTDFNARFQTVIPTSSPWLAFVAGLQWGAADEDAHGPIGFAGGIIPLVPINNATQGWLSFSVDPLLVVTGPGGDGMDFVLEGAAVLNFGAKMMPGMPFWSGLGAFFLIDQNITTESDEDSFNPVLIYGLVIPIAP